jgi:hypothetical protein
VGSGRIVDLWSEKLDFRMGPFAVLGCRIISPGAASVFEFQIS